MIGIIVTVLSAACVLVLTGLVRAYSLRKNIIDVPNSRSSHSVPTPRGGGIAIVFGFLSGLWALVSAGYLDSDAAVGIGGGGLLVAVIGYFDDHRDVAARWRLFVHFLAAGWGLYWLGGLPAFAWNGGEIEPGFLLNVFALLTLVWFLNLYNFMDGIDGIASIEAITTSSGFLVVAAIMSFSVDLSPVWLLIACVGGFLFWNFPPARIFMGDAGSGFVGLVIGLLAIYTAKESPFIIWCWVILLSVFWVDASVTLIRRVWDGQRPNEPHRSHAYQIASRKYNGHGTVTLTVAGINFVWLLPLAILTAAEKIPAFAGVVMAALPLIISAIYLGAGKKNE